MSATHSQTISLPTRLAQGLLRFVWYAVIPALLAGILLRRGVPAPETSGAALLLAFAAQVVRYPVPAYVGLFLLFSALIRYWRFYLPFGYCLARLPPELAAAVPRATLGELESAAQFRTWVVRQAERAKSESQADERARALSELDSAFQARDMTRLRTARLALERLTRRALTSRQLVEAASFVAALAVAAGAALYLRQSVFQNYSVLSSSMLPTFEKGDELNANRRAYAGLLPARGDVVVFQHAAAQEVVKRVIGLPGDEIRMHGGFPIINGWEVPHCDVGRYVHLSQEATVDGRVVVEFLGDQAYLTLHVPPARPFESYKVMPGEVFVLGDNRNLSRDSRNWREGEPSGLKLGQIVGRVERLLIGHKRNGEIDYRSLFTRLGLRLNTTGLDVSDLEQHLQECLRSRPQSALPPPPGGSPPLSQATGAL